MRALLLAATLVLAPAALAQDSAPAGDGVPVNAVTFSVRATVPTSAAPVSEEVAALSNDAQLVRLSISRTNSLREEVQVEFAFRDMADYMEWRGSDRVVALLAQLEAEAQGSGMATALQLVRPVAASLVLDEG